MKGKDIIIEILYWYDFYFKNVISNYFYNIAVLDISKRIRNIDLVSISRKTLETDFS